MPRLAALAHQDLLVEFASFKHAWPEGIYVSIIPGEASLWSGVLFVRAGPYSPAILRFQVAFPAAYPDAPPLITFSADIFHPLLTPLTTYTYTTSVSDSDTVSATDDERLPPGGFSLRHGFPRWFHKPRGSASSPRTSSGSASGEEHRPTMYEVLDYVRSTFCDKQVLNSIPLEAAANPRAFHAWEAYRTSVDVQAQEQADPASTAQVHDKVEDGVAAPSIRHRSPGQWNWEGVWEERVRKGLQASLSEPVLFGATTGDELIRFLDLEPTVFEAVIADMIAKAA